MPTFKQNPKDKALDDVYCPGQNAQSGEPSAKENVPEQSETAANQKAAVNQDNTKDNTSTENTVTEACSVESSKEDTCGCCAESKPETESVKPEAPEKVLRANFVPGPIVEDEMEKTTNESTTAEIKANLRGRSNPKAKLATGGNVQKIGELGDDEIIEENLSGKAVSPKREPKEKTEPAEVRVKKHQPAPVSSENKPKLTSARRRERELSGEDISKPVKKFENKDSQNKSLQIKKKNDGKKPSVSLKSEATKSPEKKGFFSKIVDAIAGIFAGSPQKEENKTDNKKYGNNKKLHSGEHRHHRHSKNQHRRGNRSRNNEGKNN